jgi:hypothetical protein
LAVKALWHAVAEIGVRERGGPNRGPEVDEYLRAVGLEPALGSYPWCAAFAFWCYDRAAADLHVVNPVPKTGGVLRMAEKATNYRQQRPAVGAILIQDHGGGRGHCGIVAAVGPSTVVTIEGNTDAHGGREGICVAVRVRPMHDIAGYLVFP